MQLKLKKHHQQAPQPTAEAESIKKAKAEDRRSFEVQINGEYKIIATAA
jgi:hypothetical protein